MSGPVVPNVGDIAPQGAIWRSRGAKMTKGAIGGRKWTKGATGGENSEGGDRGAMTRKNG